jgi:hypothetical protein
LLKKSLLTRGVVIFNTIRYVVDTEISKGMYGKIHDLSYINNPMEI